MSSLDEQLRVILQHAKGLRDVGVTRVEVDGVKFELQPDIPEPVMPAPKADDGLKSPLNDAATYGYAEGSPLPGFHDPRKG